MIHGLMPPSINVFIMKKEDDNKEEERSMLAEMLKRKDKMDKEMLDKMSEMTELIRYRPGTSHVGGG